MRPAAGLLTLVALSGCSSVNNWRHPELAVCEEYLKTTLVSPSSYNRAKATIADSRLPKSYWEAALAKTPKIFREYLAEDISARSLEGGRRMVFIEYDADNKFGASLRGLGSCTFEMSSMKQNKFMSTPSAGSAVAADMLARLENGEDSYGCCESRETMRRLTKFEPKAEFISQQVLD